MQVATPFKLHPLVAVAAVSVIIASATGVAALTGVLPRPNAATTEAGALPATAATPAAVVNTPSPVVVSPAPVSAPAPKPRVVRAKPRPAPEPAVVRESERYEPVQVARSEPQVTQAPRYEPAPAPVGPVTLGTVESVRAITQAGDGTGLGAVAGGVAGAVVGKQFGGGSGRKILTVLGAAGGAYAGHQVEKNARSTQRWEITVRMDDGSIRTVDAATQPTWRAGDRVRLDGGDLRAA